MKLLVSRGYDSILVVCNGLKITYGSCIGSCIGIVTTTRLMFNSIVATTYCYDLKSLEWDKRTTLVLSNTRELDKVPSTE